MLSLIDVDTKDLLTNNQIHEQAVAKEYRNKYGIDPALEGEDAFAPAWRVCAWAWAANQRTDRDRVIPARSTAWLTAWLTV